MRVRSVSRQDRIRAAWLAQPPAFTLIEMLLSLTMFGLVMSTLLMGLRGAIVSWKSVQTHQSRTAQVEWVLEAFSQDLRNLAVVSEDNPVLEQTRGANGMEVLALTRLGPRFEQRAGTGCVWSQVRYEMQEAEDSDAMDLVRKTVPFAGRSPLVGMESEEPFLKGVKTLRFSFLDGSGNEVETWSSTRSAPGGVGLFAELSTGEVLRWTVWIPVGAIQLGAAR